MPRSIDAANPREPRARVAVIGTMCISARRTRVVLVATRHGNACRESAKDGRESIRSPIGVERKCDHGRPSTVVRDARGSSNPYLVSVPGAYVTTSAFRSEAPISIVRRLQRAQRGK